MAARSVSPPANRRSSSHGQEPNVQGTLGVSKPTRKRKETPVEHQRQYVGIDLHRRRSVIVRINDDGEVLETVRVVNDPLELALAIADAGEAPEVALEATYGWYWAADLLEAEGAHVHLVHPLGLHWDSRRVKNDVLDATELAKRLSRGDLPEAWIAPPELRELRELVRYRAKLVALRISAKAQVHAVMAKLRAVKSSSTRCPSQAPMPSGSRRYAISSRSTSASSSTSRGPSPGGSEATPATGRFRRSTESGR